MTALISRVFKVQVPPHGKAAEPGEQVWRSPMAEHAWCNGEMARKLEWLRQTSRRGRQRSTRRWERTRGLQAFVGILASMLNKTRSHWKVLSRALR